MDDRRRVEFTSAELAGSVEITAPVEKPATGHSSGERKRVEGRSTGRRSWHKPPPERDRSDWAGAMQNGAMQNGSCTTDDKSGVEGGRWVAALGHGGEEGWWLAEPVENAAVEHADNSRVGSRMGAGAATI
jgi:hypothetical protein